MSKEQHVDPAEEFEAEPETEVTTTSAAPLTYVAPVATFRDRIWSSRTLVASALVSAIVGGIGGGLIVGIAGHDDEPHGWHGRTGFQGGPPVFQGGPGAPGFQQGPPPQFQQDGGQTDTKPGTPSPKG